MDTTSNSQTTQPISTISNENMSNPRETTPIPAEPIKVNHQSIYIYARRILIVLSVTLLVVLIVLALYLNGKSIYEQGL